MKIDKLNSSLKKYKEKTEFEEYTKFIFDKIIDREKQKKWLRSKENKDKKDEIINAINNEKLTNIDNKINNTKSYNNEMNERNKNKV